MPDLHILNDLGDGQCDRSGPPCGALGARGEQYAATNSLGALRADGTPDIPGVARTARLLDLTSQPIELDGQVLDVLAGEMRECRDVRDCHRPPFAPTIPLPYGPVGYSSVNGHATGGDNQATVCADTPFSARLEGVSDTRRGVSNTRGGDWAHVTKSARFSTRSSSGCGATPSSTVISALTAIDTVTAGPGMRSTPESSSGSAKNITTMTRT